MTKEMIAYLKAEIAHLEGLVAKYQGLEMPKLVRRYQAHLEARRTELANLV
jgi:hypothetical protein